METLLQLQERHCYLTQNITIAWQTRRPVQASKIPFSLHCFPFLKHVGAPTASACLYPGGHSFGETGPGPLRSMESHPLVLIGSAVGPREASYSLVMLPRSFLHLHFVLFCFLVSVFPPKCRHSFILAIYKTTSASLLWNHLYYFFMSWLP